MYIIYIVYILTNKICDSRMGDTEVICIILNIGIVLIVSVAMPTDYQLSSTVELCK